MTQSLAGKIALVTGASRGIGRATARALAAAGAAVVVNYASDESAAAQVVQDIVADGGAAHALRADVSSVTEIRRLFATVDARFGGLDILVANAGCAEFVPLAETSEAAFDRMFALNAKGTFFCLQEAARRLRPEGRIVCVSTIGTLHNLEGGAAYFGSKAALEQFCRILGKELAPRGITVNVVSPGFTATDMLLSSLDAATRERLIGMTPLGRLGEPDDLAAVIAFLAGPAARWITRQNLPVDGGIISR